MLYLVALLFPPLACLCAGRFWASMLNFVLCLTIVGIPIAMIHAWCVVKDEEKRKGHYSRIFVSTQVNSYHNRIESNGTPINDFANLE